MKDEWAKFNVPPSTFLQQPSQVRGGQNEHCFSSAKPTFTGQLCWNLGCLAETTTMFLAH